MGESWNNTPIELISGTPKDVSALRKSLISLLSSKMGEGATGYGGQVAAGLDPLQVLASNMLSQQMYGIPYNQQTVTGGSGTGGGGTLNLGNFNTPGSPSRSYYAPGDAAAVGSNWGNTPPTGYNQLGNPYYETFPSNPYYPGSPWTTPGTKPVFLPDDPMNPANQ